MGCDDRITSLTLKKGLPINHGLYRELTITPSQTLAERIADRDAAKESPQKVIRINTILADSEESGLTTKETKRKIRHATVIGLDLPHNDAFVINIHIA
ncbi:unnamed protein product [Prunus brigantina]